MKTNEAKSIFELIRQATPSEIAVVSFIVLPLLIAAWTMLLNSIDTLPQNTTSRLYLIAALCIVYILSIFIMKFVESASTREQRIVKQIQNRLELRHKYPGFGSFKYIREMVNELLTDDYLRELIKKYPDKFILGTTKDGKEAIRLVNSEEKEAPNNF